MPKLKTNSSAKKRLKVTASGKISFKQTGKRHNLDKKSKKNIRKLRKDAILSDGHAKSVLRHKLPYNN